MGTDSNYTSPMPPSYSSEEINGYLSPIKPDPVLSKTHSKPSFHPIQQSSNASVRSNHIPDLYNMPSDELHLLMVQISQVLAMKQNTSGVPVGFLPGNHLYEAAVDVQRQLSYNSTSTMSSITIGKNNLQ